MPKKYLWIVCALFLSGCSKSYTHLDLLEHPEILQSEVTRCQTSSESDSYCDMVKRTVEQYIAMVGLQQEDAEKFGQHILQAQSDLVKQKEALQQAQQEYKKMKEQNVAEAQLKAAQDKVAQAQEAYNNQLEKVQTLYAIIASTSSENL